MHSHSAGCQCEADDGEKFSLYRFVNVLALRALNASPGSNVKRVLRPESEKVGHEELFVESEDDEDDEEGGGFILVVPFTGSVRLRKVVVMAAGDIAPAEVRLFKNVDVGFESGHVPTQVLRLAEDPEGRAELSVVAAKFNDCRSLSLWFPAGRGGKARVGYIGLLGDYLKPQGRLAGVVFESMPMPKDHAAREDAAGESQMGL